MWDTRTDLVNVHSGLEQHVHDVVEAVDGRAVKRKPLAAAVQLDIGVPEKHGHDVLVSSDARDVQRRRVFVVSHVHIAT